MLPCDAGDWVFAWPVYYHKALVFKSLVDLNVHTNFIKPKCAGDHWYVSEWGPRHDRTDHHQLWGLHHNAPELPITLKWSTIPDLPFETNNGHLWNPNPLKVHATEPKLIVSQPTNSNKNFHTYPRHALLSYSSPTDLDLKKFLVQWSLLWNLFQLSVHLLSSRVKLSSIFWVMFLWHRCPVGK